MRSVHGCLHKLKFACDKFYCTSVYWCEMFIFVGRRVSGKPATMLGPSWEDYWMASLATTKNQCKAQNFIVHSVGPPTTNFFASQHRKAFQSNANRPLSSRPQGGGIPRMMRSKWTSLNMFGGGSYIVRGRGCPQVNKFEQVEVVITWGPAPPMWTEWQTETTENINSNAGIKTIDSNVKKLGYSSTNYNEQKEETSTLCDSYSDSICFEIEITT